jgi:hypothetical protein
MQKSERVASSRALLCRTTARESFHPSNTRSAAFALKRYDVTILQHQLRGSRVHDLSHELLGPGDGAFCDDKSRCGHNREPVVDSARCPSADDDRTVTAQFVDGIVVQVHVLSP